MPCVRVRHLADLGSGTLSLWTALVETKTNGNALKADQVQAYMDIAARRGYEAVITLSNDVALEGSPLVEVKVDGRRKHKVALWHLSWAEVAYQAQMLIRHEGVGNLAHAWLLRELLYYLQHDNSGCHGFQNMGPAWVPVRNGIDDETLCQGDSRALEVVESWERLMRQVCLGLGGELGQKVLPVQRTKRGTDPGARRSRLADQLCLDGKLQAELRIEGTPGRSASWLVPPAPPLRAACTWSCSAARSARAGASRTSTSRRRRQRCWLTAGKSSRRRACWSNPSEHSGQRTGRPPDAPGPHAPRYS